MKTFSMILMSIGLATSVICVVLLPIALIMNPAEVNRANAFCFLGLSCGMIMTVIYYCTDKFENVSRLSVVLMTILYCLLVFNLVLMIAL